MRQKYYLMHKKDTITGGWLILAAAVLWGTTGTAQAFSPAGFDPKVIGALRLTVGGMALLLLALSRRELGKLVDWNKPLLFWAAVFTALYQLCFFAAVSRTGVAVGTIVGIGSAPVVGGLLGRFFCGDSLSQRWYLATLLAVCGCVILSLNSGNVKIDLLGILLAIGAGASYAIYSLMIKGLLKDHTPNAVMALVICGGALLLAPVLVNTLAATTANSCRGATPGYCDHGPVVLALCPRPEKGSAGNHHYPVPCGADDSSDPGHRRIGRTAHFQRFHRD